MACHVERSDDGQIQFVACTRGRRIKPLCKCGNPSTRLCDHKLTGSKAGSTCDAPLCGQCATRIGPNLDLCPAHARAAVKESIRVSK